LDFVLTFQLAVAIVIALFVAYNVFHYVLFLLATQPKDASKIGRELNQFEQRQLIEWTPQPSDFLKHDDEKRTYDDVFGAYRDEQANYSTCVFPRLAFSHPYEAEYVLLKLKDGMRLLDLGCGSGAAAYYLANRRDIEIVCVTKRQKDGSDGIGTRVSSCERTPAWLENAVAAAFAALLTGL